MPRNRPNLLFSVLCWHWTSFKTALAFFRDWLVSLLAEPSLYVLIICYLLLRFFLHTMPTCKC